MKCIFIAVSVFISLFFSQISSDMTAKSVYDVLSSKMNLDVEFLQQEMRELTSHIDATDSALKEFIGAIKPETQIGLSKDGTSKSVDQTFETDYQKHVYVVNKALVSEKHFLRSQLNAFEVTVQDRLALMEQKCGLLDMKTREDGNWSVWGQWGICTVTCGLGMKTRSRLCTNPPSSTFGKGCTGNSDENALCNTLECPSIDGNWLVWGQWGTCTATCGLGMKTRSRLCTNPPSSTFGKGCTGNSDESALCNTHECPSIDGHWSDWTHWGTCTVTCNTGLKTRTRRCDNPPPSPLGRGCVGNSDDKALCTSHACPDPRLPKRRRVPGRRRFPGR